MLFVGDAAGVVDPMTGEGIAQALETALLAADAIAAGRRPTAPDAVPPKASAARSGATCASRPRCRRSCARPVGAAGRDRAAGLTPWTRRNFARWMFEDYPRALLLTPDRWRRGMFAGGGAYR